MDRAWNRKLTILLTLSVLPLAFCSSSSVQQNGSYETRALGEYSEGNFRHARDLLLKKSTTLYPSERYLLARCYQQLEDYDRAVSNFRLVGVDALKTENADPLLPETYCYYFSEALLDSPKVYDDSLSVASNLAFSLSTNSDYYRDTLENYLYFEWKRANVTALTNQRGSTFYRRVGQYLAGDKSQLDYILGRYSSAPNKNFYRRFLDTVRPEDLGTADLLSQAVDIAYGFGKYDLAAGYLSRQYALSHDRDYYVRNKARIDYRNGGQSRAISDLTAFCTSGAASRKTFTLLLRYIRRNYDAAYPVLVRAMKQYPGSFYTDYIKTASALGRTEELYNWYASNSASQAFVDGYAQEVLFAMLRKNVPYAKKVISNVLSRGYSPYFNYVSALLDYEDGNTESAYKKFLRITLENPFTYEWVVSLRYEGKLRDRYRSTYDAEMAKYLAQLPGRTTKLQCYYGLALKFIDRGLFDQKLGDTALSNLMAKYDATLSPYFTVPSAIPELDRLDNSKSLAWNLEYYNYVEDLIKSRAGGNDGQLARYTYRYRNLYGQLKMDGTVVTRMNGYLFDVVGGRLYHLLVPREMQETVYPLIAFDCILTNMNNKTNDALWVLSSFREESHFRKHVRSWVGAVGFAQVMPSTAETIKQNLGHPEMNNFDFADNTLLGITLFRYLFKRYEGNYAYALGGYNAGEAAVNRWRENYRHPTELWIECNEFQETRDYIKRITLSRFYYNAIYGLLPDFGYANF